MVVLSIYYLLIVLILWRFSYIKVKEEEKDESMGNGDRSDTNSVIFHGEREQKQKEGR